MSTPFRTARRPAYLAHVAEGWESTVLAPDITTARDQPLPTIGELSELPRATVTRAGPVRATERRREAGNTQTSIVEARHPEIARAISLLWGYPELNEYFDRLWLADGAHGPIDPDAMSELMLLSRVHQNIVPQRPGRSLAAFYGANHVHETPGRPRDPWGDVPPRR